MSELVNNLQEIYNIKLQIKDVLGTESDLFSDYPDLIEEAIGEGGGGSGSSTPTLDYLHLYDAIYDGEEITNSYIYLDVYSASTEDGAFEVDDSGDENIYISNQTIWKDNYDEMVEKYGDNEEEWPEGEYYEYSSLYTVYLTAEDEENMNNYIQLQNNEDLVGNFSMKPLIYVDTVSEEELTAEDEEMGLSYKFSVYGAIIPGMENAVNLIPEIGNMNSGYMPIAHNNYTILYDETPGPEGTIEITSNGHYIDVSSYMYADVDVPGYVLNKKITNVLFGESSIIQINGIDYIDNYNKTADYSDTKVIPVSSAFVDTQHYDPRDYIEYCTYINGSYVVSGVNKTDLAGLNNIYLTDTIYNLQKTDEISLKARKHSYSFDSGTSTYIESTSNWEDLTMNGNSYISYADSSNWSNIHDFCIVNNNEPHSVPVTGQPGNYTLHYYNATPTAYMTASRRGNEDWSFSLIIGEIENVYNVGENDSTLDFDDNGDGTWDFVAVDNHYPVRLIFEVDSFENEIYYGFDHYDSENEVVYFSKGNVHDDTTQIGEAGWTWRWNTEDKTLTHITEP